MFRNTAFVGFFTVLLLFPLASISEATQWDLLIQANVDNSPIYSGERPIVSGVIVDHASKPVPKASVNIKSGAMSIFTITSQSGEFMAELGKQERLPGSYIVNISASSQDGKTGIASIQFHVKGELSPTAVNESKLSTPEAEKYLDADPEDFDKNPIGFMLYNYYQKLYQEYLEDKKLSEELAKTQAIIDKQYEIENELRLKDIEEYNPGMGIFSGEEYENYVNSLDEAVRDTVVEHLNFTRNLVENAQKVRQEILENGGTAEEAQAAYLESITVTRETIENLDKNSETGNEKNFDETLLDQNTNSTDSPVVEAFEGNSTSKSPIQVNVDGINVEVDYKESIFFVNVNGTVLEFLVNGTEVSLVNDR